MISFVLGSTDYGPMLINRHDHADGNGGHYGVGYQLLNTGSFDRRDLDAMGRILLDSGPGAVLIDGGANLGVHTLAMARMMKGWGSVLAVEAQERIFYALAGNLTLQNCFNARAIWAALGEKSGSISIPEPNYSEPASFGSFELKDRPGREYIGQPIDYEEPTSTVRVIPIDEFELPRVDLIKLDIEGMEVEAIRGAKDTIKRCRPHLYIEVIKSDVTAIKDLLTGYQIIPMGMNILACP